MLLSWVCPVKYFTAVVDQNRSFDPNVVADFFFYAVSNLINIKNSPLEVDIECEYGVLWRKVSPSKMSLVLKMAFDEEISFATAFETMKCLFTGKNDTCPRRLVEQFGWFQLNDEEQINAICAELIRTMKGPAKRYRKRGETKVMGYMLDKLSEIHDNRVNTRKAIECLNRLLRPADGEDKQERWLMKERRICLLNSVFSIIISSCCV